MRPTILHFKLNFPSKFYKIVVTIKELLKQYTQNKQLNLSVNLVFTTQIRKYAGDIVRDKGLERC